MYSAEHRFTNLLMTDWESHKMWGCSTLVARGRSPHRVPVLKSRGVSRLQREDGVKQRVELPARNLSLSAGLTAITELNI